LGDKVYGMHVACYASGAQRSCAAVAVANALNSVDLIAVLAPQEVRERLAHALREDLEGRSGHQVLRVETYGAAFLRDFSADGRLPHEAGAGDTPRRAVLQWGDVDAFLHQHAPRFDQIAEALCGALRRPGFGCLPEGPLHKAVLIGGDRLLARVDRLAERAEHQGVRFRYILVN
jgi:hypothetical protein